MDRDLNKYTPVMQEYLKIKTAHRDKLLFYQMGDFYELFFEDAISAAKILDIALTRRRGFSHDEPIPMAGVPIRSLESYLKKLIKHNYSVVICGQVKNDSLLDKDKGPIKREIVSIITPGTVMNDLFLAADRDNILTAVYEQNNRYGLANFDISTGQLTIQELHSNEFLQAELARISPKEILISQSIRSLKMWQDYKEVREIDDRMFDFERACKLIKNLLKIDKIAQTDFYQYKIALSACGSLLNYLYENHFDKLSHIDDIIIEKCEDSIVLDVATRASLELTESLRGETQNSLLEIMNCCSTAMGKRLLRRRLIRPIKDSKILEKRLDAISELKDRYLYQEIKIILQSVGDMERILSRIALLSAQPRDLVNLRETLAILPNLQLVLQKCSSLLINEIGEMISQFPDLLSLLERAVSQNPPFTINEGRVIAAGFDLELDKLRKLNDNIGDFLLRFEEEERRRINIDSLKIGFNRIDGYFFEISNAKIDKIPDGYAHCKTLKNKKRFKTEKLHKLEEKILNSKSLALTHEKMIYETLLVDLARSVKLLKRSSQGIAELDVISNLAERTETLSLVKPEFSEKEEINIVAGRHLIVEKMQNRPYIANDTNLEQNCKMMVVTGPNMGGKSTYMRQIALIVILAYIGSFVPAESARIGFIDRIFTRIGSSDDLARGKSTFMVEMNEMANILRFASSKSLVLIDEIGRGTSTFDGISLAWASAKYLAQMQSFVIFATHYFELTDLAYEIENVVNFYVGAVKQNQEIIFLYTLKKGSVDKSYGIEVAKLAGIPQKVIFEAQEVLKNLEDRWGNLRIKTEDKDKMQQSEQEKMQGEIISILKNLNLNEITPREALEKLYFLKDLC